MTPTNPETSYNPHDLKSSAGNEVVEVRPPSQVTTGLTTVPTHPPSLPPTESDQLMALLKVAVEQKMPVETIERLQQMVERHHANRARQAFHAAFAAFRGACPPAPRNRRSQFKRPNKAGVLVPHTYSDIEDMASVADPLLPRYGLSYRWGDVKIEGTQLTREFLLSHADGHTEKTPSPPIPIQGVTSREGKEARSQAQSVEAADTYARRLAMSAGLGVTGVEAEEIPNEPAFERITEEQARQLNDLFIAGWEDRAELAKQRWMAARNLRALRDLPAASFETAVAEIQRAASIAAMKRTEALGMRGETDWAAADAVAAEEAEETL